MHRSGMRGGIAGAQTSAMHHCLIAISMVAFAACGGRHADIYLGADLKRAEEASSGLRLDEGLRMKSYGRRAEELALTTQDFEHVTVRTADGTALFELEAKVMVRVLHDADGIVTGVSIRDPREDALDMLAVQETIKNQLARLGALGWKNAVPTRSMRASLGELRSCGRRGSDVSFALEHPTGANLAFKASCDELADQKHVRQELDFTVAPR